MTPLTVYRDEFRISTDPQQLDLQVIHRYLSQESYWAKGVPFEIVARAAKNSLNFGLYTADRQIGYARIISDLATVAYLGDVFVLAEFRGQGLSKWLMETVRAHPDLQGLRRWVLLTADAHGLYERYGWKSISDPTKWMEIHQGNPYLPAQEEPAGLR